MDIVISGAIPHHSIAEHMVAQLQKLAPNFTRLWQSHKTQLQSIDTDAIGCTALEHYLLRAHGFQAPTEQYCTGLGPLYMPSDWSSTSQQAIYLMELGHIQIGQTGASLQTAAELAITPAQSLALFESAQALFTNSPYKLLAYHPDYFLLDLGTDFALTLPSPALLAMGNLADWWPQDPASRPLRLLIGELQMLWFNHPVNQQRQAQNLPAINTAWIFGGASRATIRTQANPPYQLIRDLEYSHRQQDWGLWFNQLIALDNQLPELAQTADRFVMSGFDRLVYLSALPFWQANFLYKNAWKKTWSPIS